MDLSTYVKIQLRSGMILLARRLDGHVENLYEEVSLYTTILDARVAQGALERNALLQEKRT